MKTSHKSDELKQNLKKGVHKSGTYDIEMFIIATITKYLKLPCYLL
jgi:hypothetical protein